MEEITCPQCRKTLKLPSARLVQDSCGHKKCRMCLLQDEAECRMCLQSAVVESNVLKKPEPSVIRYENNHAAVITCNKSVVRSVPNRSSNDCQQIVASSNSGNNYNNNNKTESNLPIKLNNKNKEGQSSKAEKVQTNGQKRVYKFITLPSHVSILSENPITYKCTICNKMFRTKSHVKYHIYCAGDRKPLHCKECNKEFISKYHYETHYLAHTEKKNYTCNVCYKSFRRCGILNRHKLIHSELKKFVCQQCGKTFKSKDYLQRHVQIHKGEKPFHCKLCNAKFNNRSNLNKHKLTHSQEKIHMCDECGKRFKLKSALTVHRRSHLRIRPHKCGECGKAFINSKELRRHQQIHLDVLAYSCSFCDVSFIRKDNLQRHVRNTHPGKKATYVRKPLVKRTSRTNKQPQTENTQPVENPNAINVITAPPTCQLAVVKKEPPVLSKPVPVINAPLKLAFKTTAFKSHYNIHSREYVEPTKKPFDYAESVSICQKILSPSSPPPHRTIIKTLGNVSEKDSTEICQKILSPMIPPVNSDTSIPRSYSISNIKFKLPSKYIDLSKRNILNDLKPLMSVEDTVNLENQSDRENTYTELKPVPPTNAATSVIVNSHSTPPSEMHWRRRTLQNLEMQSKHGNAQQ